MDKGNKVVIDTFYDWIIQNIPEGKVILELGSGETTVKLCNRYKVISIEHNIEYVGLAKDSNYIHAEIIDYKSYRWYSKDKLEPIKNMDYDFILVDGPTVIIGRIGFLHNSDLFNTNVPILIDDTNRPAELKLANELSKKLNKKMKPFGGLEKSFIILS